jgi:hypothetical protein
VAVSDDSPPPGEKQRWEKARKIAAATILMGLAAALAEAAKISGDDDDEDVDNDLAAEPQGVFLRRLAGGAEIEICNPTAAILKAVERVGEDDPSMCLDWNAANLSAAVAWANQQQPPLPLWSNAAAAYPITAAQVQEDLARILADAGSGSRIGTALLAPNSLGEYSAIRDQIRDLMLADAFLQAICGNGRAPLARVYVISDRQHKTTGMHLQMHPLPAGPGVQVFE